MADYERLCSEAAKIAKGDQRRAFSDEYANLLLTTCHSYIEVSTHSPLAQMERISPAELKNTPCILVASKTQQETEQAYYHDVIGFHGQFLYADTLEEARLMVIGRKGFLPVEGTGQMTSAETSIVRIPLVRRKEPLLRNYCAFWKKENSGYYVEEFAKLLKVFYKTDFGCTKTGGERGLKGENRTQRLHATGSTVCCV